MQRIARRAALALACAALGAGVCGPGSAAGFENFYCGVLLNEGSWCGDGTNHNYNFNRATYNGTGNVWVCQRLLYADTATEVSSPTCAYNLVSKSYSNVFLTEAEVDHNTGTTAQHTIYGYATA